MSGVLEGGVLHLPRLVVEPSHRPGYGAVSPSRCGMYMGIVYDRSVVDAAKRTCRHCVPPLEWFNTNGGTQLGMPSCPDCFDWMARPGMAEAAASVGIEHGKSTGLMLRDAVESYHANGHRELV